MCALFAFAMQSQDNHDHRPTEVDKDGDGSIDFDEFLAMMIDIRDNSECRLHADAHQILAPQLSGFQRRASNTRSSPLSQGW